ncbi:hypothetical protein G6R40_06770 [Chryseobacterium sp. POL2]|uniref:hypothetical protein n=1 Tax=Chryseobacterium sp. POL2 TaxID=2713414 RepID=UPI0013E1CCCC|nr:hypothetical protein [Chryseobacterium sp. POL2]QIG89399.1 hypothetical protein G6R40_06770 [Chryseobacterium sp. POL2]
MEKVNPILYKNLTPLEYGKEFDRIDKEIKGMDDVDFQIIINTDIPFYFDYMITYNKYRNCKDCYNPTFKEFKQKPIYVQKSAYTHYLKMLFMFPRRFQQN